MVKSSKVISTKALVGGGAHGGPGHMYGKQTVGTRTPSVTGKKDSGGGGKFAKGGSGHMYGKQTVKPSRSGVTGK